MSDPRAWMIAYLAARGDVPWRWADDGNVITWADGSTICFREEIIYILEWLLPHGWPSFGALVWLLAACRGKQPPALEPASPSVISNGLAADLQHPLSEFRSHLRQMYQDVERGLAEVSRLPQELRGSIKAKAVLAETVFGDGSGAGPFRALLEDALQVLRSGELTDLALNAFTEPPPGGMREWDDLRGGLARVAPESLAVRLRTGLDALPQPAKIPLPPAARMRQLLNELRADPEHAGLARLARDFMAALQLPRKLAENDDLPIGGLADIANRGNLDRLLLSELAHDDLTLAVRIALGEALYLRREPPARQPPVTVAVLIDSGVRLWGVPRVLAAGIAMALIAKSAPHERLAVYRASGAEIAPTDLLEKAGILTHLGALEPHAHPGAALQAFRDSLRGLASAEAVIVTHRDAAEDADFQRSLAFAQFDSLYLALVDREGRFELRRYPHTGQALCQAQVSLDDLLPPPPKISQPRQLLLDLSAKPDLPLIFSMNPFPLRLAVFAAVQYAVSTGLCVTRGGRLLEWINPGHGARTLAHGLPRGITMLLTRRPDRSICVVKVEAARHVFCRIYAQNGTLQHSHEWRFSDPVRRVEIHGSALIVVRRRETSAMDLLDAKELARIATPRALTPPNSRYFLVGADWVAATWDGRELKLMPLAIEQSIRNEGVHQLFSREGFEGPWVITRRGNIYSPDGKCFMQLGNSSYVRQISPAGHRLLLHRVSPDSFHVVDLASSAIIEVKGKRPIKLQDDPVTPPTRSVRCHFDRIVILPEPAVALYSRRSGWWKLTLVEETAPGNAVRPAPGATQTSRLALTPISAPDLNKYPPVDFQPLKALSPLGFALALARWPDGRCAWLDRQGMLHLRSAQPGVPETTIVLCDSPMAAWSSDGRRTGAEFFRGGHKDGPAVDIWQSIRNFCWPIP